MKNRHQFIMRLFPFHVSLVTFAVLLFSCDNQNSPADLLLVNGTIITVDDARPKAQAVAVRGDRIIAVGSDTEINAFRGTNTKVIDLQGKLLIPGFIESHAHLQGIGNAQKRLKLQSANNWNHILEMVRVAVSEADPGEWILGRGWHQEKWNQTPEPSFEGIPYHQSLSAISPDNPVWLVHASGHSSIANAAAMKLAGITEETPNPDGGEIVRDKRGKLIGLFRETAVSLIDSAYTIQKAGQTPAQRKIERKVAIKLAIRECLAKGITSFQDAGSSFESIDLLKQMAEENELDIRLWVMIGEGLDSLTARLPEYKIIGAGNNHLTVRAIKTYMDGALGSHGAWLLSPYDDMPSSSGLNVTPLAEIKSIASLAVEHNFQLCTHAIGDRGNREILDIYQSALESKTDLRWRVEHAQHLAPADIPRFAQMSVIASMQGVHCTSDGPWVPKRIGNERAKNGAYVWSTLMKSGAVIVNGTDAPVEDVSPLANFYASVSRMLPDGTRFFESERMTREQALRSYTINAAFAAFEEEIKGSITVGKLADFTVLSENIMTIPEEEILTTEVVYTIVGGVVLYEKPAPTK